MKHEEYTRYIVETLYSLVNLNEELSERKCKIFVYKRTFYLRNL